MFIKLKYLFIPQILSDISPSHFFHPYLSEYYDFLKFIVKNKNKWVLLFHLFFYFLFLCHSWQHFYHLYIYMLLTL